MFNNFSGNICLFKILPQAINRVLFRNTLISNKFYSWRLSLDVSLVPDDLGKYGECFVYRIQVNIFGKDSGRMYEIFFSKYFIVIRRLSPVLYNYPPKDAIWYILTGVLQLASSQEHRVSLFNVWNAFKGRHLMVVVYACKEVKLSK